MKKNIFFGVIFTLVMVFILSSLPGIIRFAGASASALFTQKTSTATTSPSFMTPGTATTTYQIDSGGTFGDGSKLTTLNGQDQVYMFLMTTASTSATTFAYQIQYSNNNIDWYGESINQGQNYTAIPLSGTASIMLESTSTVTHYYTPGVTTATTRAILLPPVIAQHERVIFTLPTISGNVNGSVYAEFNIKRNPSTP